MTAFVAFRWFDIRKPGPVRWAEEGFHRGHRAEGCRLGEGVNRVNRVTKVKAKVVKVVRLVGVNE